MKARLCFLAVLALLLAGCATPGYVEQGGENRVSEVFLPGVSPAQAQAKVLSTQPKTLTIVEQRPEALVYRTPEPVRPVVFARWSFTPRSGGTVVRFREEYRVDGQVLVVNNPKFLDQEQRGLNALKILLPGSTTSSSSRTALARTTAPPRRVASHQCAAITRKGYRCSRMARPGSKYCWQHGG